MAKVTIVVETGKKEDDGYQYETQFSIDTDNGRDWGYDDVEIDLYKGKDPYKMYKVCNQDRMLEELGIRTDLIDRYAEKIDMEIADYLYEHNIPSSFKRAV